MKVQTDVRSLMKCNLSSYVKSYCETKRITQNEFAKEVGLSKATLSAYLTGQRFPRPEQIGTICFVLSIEPAELFTEHCTLLS